jgi:coenzyme F420-0:L-glutamate ligase
VRKASLIFIPIGVKRKEKAFDLTPEIIYSVENEGEKIRDGDIIAVSSKFISMSKGRYVKLDEVRISKKAKNLATKLDMDAAIAQLVLLEADEILGGVSGFALTMKNGVIAPNAGIDRSNAPPGHVMLYSKDSYKDAEDLKKEIFQLTEKRVGVLVTDSRLMPLRMGTTGLAIGIAGFEPLLDERGKSDLFGNVLKVTRRSLADQMAASVQILMGEADEGFPIIIIRSSDSMPWKLTDQSFTYKDLAVDNSECIYMRGIPRKKFVF